MGMSMDMGMDVGMGMGMSMMLNGYRLFGIMGWHFVPFSLTPPTYIPH